MKPKVLIIEDDSTMREGMETVLSKSGYSVTSVSDGLQGAESFRTSKPDLVITDLKLPGKSGMELLKEFQEHDADIPVVLISAFGTIDLAVNALKLGARDFIAKPFSIEELRAKIAHVFAEGQAPKGHKKVDLEPGFHGLIGDSEEMQILIAQIKKMGQANSPVLIRGDSGTGKELIARAIHRESTRSSKELLAVNCSALTDTLLESELFGHEKGAFTGAFQQHIGIFERAHEGTILLDEIGDISPQMQVKLLRVLQDQTFQRVGGRETIKVDVRVIAATNRDLEQAIQTKQFREDLYFRLNVLALRIPALKNRVADIPALVEHFIGLKCARMGRDLPNVPTQTMEKLMAYTWPGNIRELENFLERLLIFTEGDEIQPSEIYFETPSAQNSVRTGQLNDVLEETEQDLIRSAMHWAGGVRQKAARKLGIKTSTLYYKLEKYGMFEEFGGKQNRDEAEQ